ncbi:hypothetical protein SAMN04489712_107169 [Thermomonospora echinospora]|uniref:Uncharacterized protein n=1 Tax=Thermomonospora echinospora TaxID=1992 RepID=A0A1H6BJM6_9ACTN|nr:hypothetical protein [Thermomonospora echinospora]SEG60938.1 hypothetical protein SAMN04489712_107169 [Thermomonospora echinospora]
MLATVRVGVEEEGYARLREFADRVAVLLRTVRAGDPVTRTRRAPDP